MGEEKEEIEKVSKKGKERGKKQKSNNKKNNNDTKSNIKNKKTNNIIDKEIKDKEKKEKGKNKDKKSKSELKLKTKNEDKKTEENGINKEDILEDIIESDNIDELENTKSNKEKRVVLDSVGKVKIDEIETEEQLEKLQEKTNEKLKENNKEDVKIITKKELEEDIQKKVIEKLGNNRKKRISIIIFLVLISFIAIISTCFSVIYMGKDVIVPNVYIGDINVGNMSKEKAKEKLETIYTEKASKEIKASLKDYEHIIKPEMVEFKVDINSAVDKAYMIGRNRKYNRK